MSTFKKLATLFFCLISFAQFALAQGFSLSPAQGPFNDCPNLSNRQCPSEWSGSGMQPAQLVKSGLTAGTKIRIGTVTGMATWGGTSTLISPSPCKEGAAPSENLKPKLLVVFQFTDEALNVIDPGFATPGNTSAFTALEFEGKIVNVPQGATRLYASFPDSRYNDNSGTCVGSINIENGTACNDGIDNDGDGSIDFPNDLGCSSATDTTETTGKQCDNGQDDDGDGKIDALSIIDPNNNLQYVVSNGDPFVTRDFQAGKAVQYGLVPATEDAAILLDQATGKKICNMAGYAEVVAMACESPKYNGRCGYSTPRNNRMLRWSSTINNFEFIPAKGNNNWIATLSCKQRIAQCRNGLDDDQDGKIDMNDPNCANPDDNSEKNTHDPDCTGPDDDKETPDQLPACSDKIDNDGDTKIDYPADPGCSSAQDTDEKNPNGPQCDNGKDDDADGKVDFPADTGCTGPEDNDETNAPDLTPPVCKTLNTNFTDGRPVLEWSNVEAADSYEVGIWRNTDGVRVYTGDNIIGQLTNGTRIFRIPETAALQFGGYSFRVKSKKGTTQSTWCNANPVLFSVVRCQDSIDNDGDGLNNHPTDPGCESLRDNDERTGKQCDDGVDNDKDGKVDYPADTDCKDINDDNETRDPQCSDGKDNDADGKIDYPADPGCSSATDDNERTGKQCDDGADNDNDGKIDFPADLGCSDINDDTESGEPACRDGKDNDNDGKVDYPADPGCTSADDNDERTGKQCDDGKDNDADGKIDFPADSDCTDINDDTESPIPACKDGKDNDGDGKIDFPNDPGCLSADDNDERTGKQCDDGKDNDGDKSTDYPADKGCIDINDDDERTGKQCDDGKDNDGDGFVDLQDPGCTDINDDTESGEPACSDKKDNDGDGKVDFPADPGCANADDNSERTDLQCDDGKDNDGDGKIDFGTDPAKNDPDCTSITDDSEAKTPACSDGIDNDNDKKIDYPADPGCTSATDDSEYLGTACDDGSDNDLDGKVDLSDPGCENINDDSERTGKQCDDGIDNDGDKQIDHPIDTNCVDIFDDSEAPDKQCSDGKDNDADGKIDFGNDISKNDPGCASPEDDDERTGKQCDDGIDNDKDGKTDYPADPECTSINDDTENPVPACSDGIDNDRDGKIDLADPDCEGPDDDDEQAAPQCSDKIDNDGDKLIDFPSDPGCASAADMDEFNGDCSPGQTETKTCSTGKLGICSEGTATRICGSNSKWGDYGSCTQTSQPTAEICTDRADNDCDGKVDDKDEQCVKCDSSDQSEKIRVLDANAKRLGRRISSIARIVAAKAETKKKKQEAKKISLAASNAGVLAWQAAWQIPSITLSCQDSNVCTSNSTLDKKNAYMAVIAELDALMAEINKQVKKYKNLSKKQKQTVKTKNQEYADYSAEISTAMNSIPDTTFSCPPGQ